MEVIWGGGDSVRLQFFLKRNHNAAPRTLMIFSTKLFNALLSDSSHKGAFLEFRILKFKINLNKITIIVFNGEVEEITFWQLLIVKRNSMKFGTCVLTFDLGS